MELLLDLKKRYTYADYLTWADDKVCELIDGFINMMSPSARPIHQEVSLSLCYELKRFIKKNKRACKVYPDIDVRLPQNGEKADDQIYNVVRPDISVICDLSKIDDKGCLGAPDMIVEVQSFSSAKYDLNEKFNLYQASGVVEYWVVYPREAGIEVFLLQPDGTYDRGTRYEMGIVPVHIFDGYKIDFKDIF
ncbi:MAG: Uma2 family endonuclease [Bacteroidetes bacterium]|nr:Uma2 family endonuclease [Bacteroidota bacterium]